MQIRTCPQALQSYIFLILWNSVELIHLIAVFIHAYGHVKSFLTPLLMLFLFDQVVNRLRGKDDPHRKT